MTARAAHGVHEIPLLSSHITVGRGALSCLGDIAASTSAARFALIADANVAKLHRGAVEQALPSDTRAFVVPTGEAQKTRETWSRLTDEMIAAGFGRDACVVALGGGVIGDLAGFVAATYMRGIPVIQIPTSLLAMIDASIGGKTGVDTAAGKNLVGAFHQPAAVIVDPEMLSTLPQEHLRAGLAEALKHGVIRDAAYFELIDSHLRARGLGELDQGWLAEVVKRGIEIKAAVVTSDEREHGLRKTLNFGHTIGHAVELLSNYRVLHGEAVAIGMVVEADIAERVGVAEHGTAASIRDAVRVAGLPVKPTPAMQPLDVIRATRTDKKVRAGRVEYALPARVGQMAAAENGWALPVADGVVEEALRAAW